MTKKSILMIVRKYPADFGHTTVINNLCIRFQKHGHRTGIGAFSFDSHPPENIEEIRLNKFKLLFNGLDSLNYDVVFLHQSFPNYFLLPKKTSKIVILYFHGSSTCLQKYNFKIFMKLFQKRLSKIISVSNEGVNQMKKILGNDLSAEVIYNGVDTSIYNTNVSKSFKKGSPQLLFVGGLRGYKNVDFLINLMPLLLEKYPESYLQIIGSGEDFDKLKKLVVEKKLEKHIELVGEIKKSQDLALYYNSCDIYISASSLEACPVPPFEAMACGKSILLSDIDAHKEIVSASNSGDIFSLQNLTSVVEKIARIYQQKDTFSKNALDFIRDYDWDSVMLKVKKTFE